MSETEIISGTTTREVHVRFVYRGAWTRGRRGEQEMIEAPFSVADVEHVFGQIGETFDLARRIASVQEGNDARFAEAGFEESGG